MESGKKCYGIMVLNAKERSLLCEVLDTDWLKERLASSEFFKGRLADIEKATEKLCSRRVPKCE